MTQQELKNCILILNDMEQNICMMTRMDEKLDEEINKQALNNIIFERE